MSNAFTGTPQAHGSGSHFKSAVVKASDQMRTTHREPRSAHQVFIRIAAEYIIGGGFDLLKRLLAVEEVPACV